MYRQIFECGHMQIRNQKSQFIITHSDYVLDDRIQSAIVDRWLGLFV